MAESSSKLQPFLLLARSTKGAAAAKIILDVTAAPGVYVFSELLELPNIQELKDQPEHQNAYRLLELFAYGTLSDYDGSSGSFPPLSPTHLTKLKHLTLVSLALGSRSLHYDKLLSTLDVQSIRALEDVIIDTIYAGLLKGKMHHHERVLHIDWVAGRDVREDDLARIHSGLENWCSTATSLLTALEEQISAIRSQTHTEQEQLSAYNARRNTYLSTLMEQQTSSNFSTRSSRTSKSDDPAKSNQNNGFGAFSSFVGQAGRVQGSKGRQMMEAGDGSGSGRV
ncbi:hypothetical protein DB88DRAFT_496830 [Papiliotrema laurentii]|uniref:PCI domain-containing protein n=1 Tax=Papiliotrema laurentii TaxID=5418 RepID=A0AAD9CWP0_PAPLA|nr:hypothetical protein DB88DRAFT_496830 [Papiliotrema laurentii]